MNLPKRLSPDNKTACLIHSWGEKYSSLSKNSYNSFVKHHPDVDVYLLDEKEIIPFLYPEIYNFEDEDVSRALPQAIRAYVACNFMIDKMKYEKVIKLGGDTITTGRLDEFMRDIEQGVPLKERVPVLASLDYYGSAEYPFFEDEFCGHDVKSGKVNREELFGYDNLTLINTNAHFNKSAEGDYRKALMELGGKSNTTPEEVISNMRDKIISESFDEENYREGYAKKDLKMEIHNLNADVICFNGAAGVSKIIAVFEKYNLLQNNPTALAHIAIKTDKELGKAILPDRFSRETVEILLLLIAEKNKKSVKDIAGAFYHNLNEQGALNIFANKYPSINVFQYLEDQALGGLKDPKDLRDMHSRGEFETIPSVEIVDLTNTTNVCYNVRGFGELKPENKNKNLKDFYVRGKKLYNHTGREVKVFHYCDAIGSKEELHNSSLVKEYLDEKFHSKFKEDVIEYLKDECGCENLL